MPAPQSSEDACLERRGEVEELLAGIPERKLLEGLELFLLRGEPCPYFPDPRERLSLNFAVASLDPALYEALLGYGWRRCGALFYKNLCPACSLCVPIRVLAERFKPARVQSRAWARNSDLEVEIGPAGDSDEDFDLYFRYCSSRHGAEERKRDEFRFFLAFSPLPSVAIRCRLAGRLLSVAWTDILPESLSAVYTAFEPEMPRRSLGVFSILVQIDACRRLSKRFLQLGFQVDGCRKMQYKSLYRPFQTPDLASGAWRE